MDHSPCTGCGGTDEPADHDIDTERYCALCAAGLVWLAQRCARDPFASLQAIADASQRAASDASDNPAGIRGAP